jgi:SAM-dependent methyltransferase
MTDVTIDEDVLMAFTGQVVADMGAAISGLLVHVGDRLGLYKALAADGPMTSAELAERTGTHERYVREWAANQAAGGYLTYDPATTRFTLPPEHAMCLADEDSPVFLCGGFEGVSAAWLARERLVEVFTSGSGIGWHEHDHCLFSGTERFFRPGYRANLADAWLPALDGAVEQLRAGARVADVGCGHGASTIVMAQAFPQSTFVGFDPHDASVAAARKAASEAGVADRVTFEVASAQDFPGTGFDLVAFFDCLHDMGDPVGALRHVRSALADGGLVMLVEPFAHDRVEDNLNPVGRAFYGFSTVICTPGSLSQDVGRGLGAQAGEARLRQVAEEAGFATLRRATETPFNLVLELRP